MRSILILVISAVTDEDEASEWISGRSEKKFLIADEVTVAGYEFDTVIIVTDKMISSLCQRATARLIVCLCENDFKLSSDSENELSSD